MRDIHNVVIVKVEACNGVFGLRLLGFFLDRNSFVLIVELHDAVTLGVGNRIGEHNAAVGVGALLEVAAKGVAIKDVVAQNQRDLVRANKLFANDKRFGQTARIWLSSVIEMAA